MTKESENLGGEKALYYRYQLNFKLENKDIDEVEYFQIVPFYEDGGLRISRIHYYEDNSNGFNIDNAIFWNSRISSPKVQVTGVERIATTEDDFGFELPKLKLYVTDWGTTHQFYDGEKLTKEQLVNYNRLTDLTYAGELISKIGDTITSILDKIKSMLGEFEYFYNLDGRFVF